MKYLYLIFAIMSFYCCSSETEVEIIEKVNFEQIKQYIPFSALENFNKVFYKDLNGNEKPLVIIKESRCDTFERNGERYASDYHMFVITEQFSFDYSFILELTGRMTNSDEFTTELNCFFSSTENNQTPWIGIDEDGQTNDLLRGDLTFGGKMFEDVIRSKELSSQQNGFSKFYYNYDFGVVAFEDATENLWIFDRFQ